MTVRSPEAVVPGASPVEHTLDAPASLQPSAGEVFPLAIRNVTKRWRKDLPLVLDGVDLALEPGSLTWVGGRNGAGKTTLLRIAAGLIEPEQGRAEVWGVSVRENRVRYQTLVSFLPAGDRGLYARLTVRRQLEFCDRMSMGQRQRLRIAMTFLPDPETVLLDEPLTSLDDEGAAVLMRAIRRLLDRDGVVVWCSPSGERLDMSFDARWVIDRGRLAPA